MKNIKNKIFLSIALILLLTTTTFLMCAPTSQALDIPTYPKITVNPNPIGLGQTVYINAFMTKPTPTAGMAGSGDQYEGITVEITRPDGTKQTIGPLRSDSTGGTWASLTPTQVGTYSAQMKYPGGTLVGGGSVFGGGGFNWTGSVLLPSVSEIVTFVVQQNPIHSPYYSPALPTEYWSRPIYATNYAWASLGGSWLGLASPSFATTGMYDAMGNVQLYTTAPNTGHIIWTKPTHFGGLPGEPIPADQSSQYTSTSIAINHFEPIILNGILYYTNYVSANSRINGWTAVDLRTGEIVWERTAGESGNEVIKMGQILRFHTQQEYGSVAYLWSSPQTSFFQSATFYSIYDAMTGKYLANVTSISGASLLMDYSEDQPGTILGWYASGGWLRMWNSTLMLLGGNKATTAQTATAVKVSSSSYNWTNGIQYQVEIPNKIGSVTLASNMSVAAVTPEVVLTRYYASPGMFQEMGYGYQITAGFNAKTGQLLWGPLNQSMPYLQDIAMLTARNGVYILHNKDTNEAYGYSLTNGAKLWGPVKLPGNAWSSISRDAEIAYGKVLIWDFGGYVNALDPQTGQILWTLTPRSAGYDAPYGIYPLWHFGTQTICDGKLFLSEGSMYNPPIHPSYRLAINITDGSIIWRILSYSGRIPAAHADTYMVQWNSFDCQIYTFGKGPTATTIDVSPKISVKGSQILIEGRVTDESAGTKNSDRIARFPNGVPAVADECMSDWMEYVYMQQTKPTNNTGVPVALTAIDPNGNFQEIGTAISNGNGNYAITWTPPVPGLYTIMASFCGSESYWGSEAETAFVVSEAPAASPAVVPTSAPTVAPTAAPTVAPTATPSPSVVPEPEAAPATEMYIIAVAATAIIVVVAAAALFLRKRQ